MGDFSLDASIVCGFLPLQGISKTKSNLYQIPAESPAVQTRDFKSHVNALLTENHKEIAVVNRPENA